APAARSDRLNRRQPRAHDQAADAFAEQRRQYVFLPDRPESLRQLASEFARAGPGRFPSSPNHRMKIGRVIRAADKRTGGDIEKTFLARDIAVVIELIRRDVLDNRQMSWA